MLTRQQVVYGLERVELRQTDLFRNCPYTPRRSLDDLLSRAARQSADENEVERRCPPPSHPYRTADGSCNNLRNRDWGSAFSPFLRFLPAVYGDTVGAEFRGPTRRRRGNQALPSPRTVSSSVHRDSSADTQQFSMMVSQAYFVFVHLPITGRMHQIVSWHGG